MEEPSLLNICRSCLAVDQEMQSVFVTDERTGLNIQFADMIMAYASVQIISGDGLPEQICLTCVDKVSKLYMFKQQLEESDTILRQRFYKIQKPTDPTTIESNEMDDDTINIIIKPEFDLGHVREQDSEQPNEQEDQSEDDSTEPDIIETLEDEFQQEDDLPLIQSYKDDNDSDYSPKKQIYKCDVCKKLFNRQSHLRRHKSVHAHNKPHVCDVCNKGFSRADLLLRHHVTHSENLFSKIKSEEYVLLEAKLEDDEEGEDEQTNGGGEKFNCTECEKMFNKKESLTNHQLRMHVKLDGKDKVLVCPVCSKKFMKPSHLTRHLKIHASVKQHNCNLCNKGFARGEQLINHMNVHSGVKPHVCSICSKGFNQISNLKDHMRTHNGERPFLCSICGKGFNQLGNLRQHTIRHSGIKAHLCSICGNGFASKGELGAHLRKHTGARPFVCNICNHGFTTSSSLTKHKRIHSGEKPYECEVCKMKFSRSGILARHKRTHTGEKPYVCKFCAKAFAQSNDLSSHLRIHTGEKPFICDICGQAFRQSSALKTHKKTHMDRTQMMPMGHATGQQNDKSMLPLHTQLQLDRNSMLVENNKNAIPVAMISTTLLNNVIQ